MQQVVQECMGNSIGHGRQEKYSGESALTRHPFNGDDTSEIFQRLGKLTHCLYYLSCTALNFVYHLTGLIDQADALIDLVTTSLHAVDCVLS